jgi:hypothetical protein
VQKNLVRRALRSAACVLAVAGLSTLSGCEGPFIVIYAPGSEEGPVEPPLDAGVDPVIDAGTEPTQPTEPTEPTGPSCENDDFCNVGVTCQGGLCLPRACDGQSDCSPAERCSATAHTCGLASDTLYGPCLDAQGCTGPEVCDQNGRCVTVCAGDDAPCRAGERCESDNVCRPFRPF